MLLSFFVDWELTSVISGSMLFGHDDIDNSGRAQRPLQQDGLFLYSYIHNVSTSISASNPILLFGFSKYNFQGAFDRLQQRVPQPTSIDAITLLLSCSKRYVCILLLPAISALSLPLS